MANDNNSFEVGLNGEMRDSRATKMSQIYTPSEWSENPVEIRGLNEGYDRLRGAILEQAVVDYMKALRTIMRYPPEYREYSLALYRFGNAVDRGEDVYEQMDEMRKWGIKFQVTLPKKARWYGFTGKNLTNEQLEAIYDWNGEFYSRLSVQPNKVSRGINAVRKAWEMKQDCERFFNSDLYRSLCRLDKDYLLRVMREKVEEEYETGTIQERTRKTRTKANKRDRKHSKHHRTNAL